MPEKFENDRPIYLQLVERIQHRIMAGQYPPGAKLESVRELAEQAGVNPNTMQRALAELERQGLVRAERTAGRFVTEDTTLIEQMKNDLAREMVRDFVGRMRQIGYTRQQLAALILEAGQTEQEGAQHG